MRIIFMGSPEFAIPALKRLLESRHEIVAVVTSPDKPKGRGLKVESTPVKILADKKKIRTLQPKSLKDPEFIEKLKQINADLYVVVAFRILPEELLSIPPKGIINLHPSDLPKYRGAAPINWAIINGEKATGITTFLIEKTVDTGQILMKEKASIGEDETAGELSARLAELGADLMLKTIDNYENNKITPIAQDDTKATKAPKIKKEDCVIDWKKSNREVKNFIRGLSPNPGAFTYYNKNIIKIFQADLSGNQREKAIPGEIINVDKNKGILVACGKGAVIVKDLMKEGRKRMTVQDFLRGSSIKPGERFGNG